ncbi:Zinc finger, MIZ-type [Kalmanozyma brasiliensis GHG001]|uniref:Uncharacterized protein n=1 Tax=Kalmanozyma brasiliensis (strain GHG001) TaxID=1365824 RepID=V5EWX9_KALBG|nr:Zinc finger, MIZ-type [Kalmanozyma brasiliensis GHG001]EST06874.1 Zinc finger, MIZ-type [Kalmanozyma brasiliensis GHG001]
MAADVASSGFADHAILLDSIRSLTLAQAKALIKDLNNEPEATCGRLIVSGNKPDLLNRLAKALGDRKSQGDIRGYQRFRTLIYRYKSPPIAPPAYRNGASSSAGTYGGLSAPGAYSAHPQVLGGTPANRPSGLASSSYSPIAPVPSVASTSRPVGAAGSARINFRPSPFYEIKQFVSSVVQCPEAPTQADRKNVPIFVSLNAEQVQQLSTPKYQLKLFCTTTEAHAASLSGRNPATIEFPLTCEARVNNTTLSINLRGSKKHIGRVPPPNLNKDNALVLREARPNRIDLTYTNAPKKYVLVAAICEVTSVETLVGRLRSKQLRSKEDVLSRMRKEAEDDDIQTGAATMSLKCPLSYMRINTPCRSIHCSHVECFDAESFFSMNEQSPSWACPSCHKIIKPEELLMDGYVDDILKKVPQDQDSVIVEPDGSWRTLDGKISSNGAANEQQPSAEGTPLEDRLLCRDSEDIKPGAGAAGKQNGTKKASPEIVLLDSPSPPPTAGSAPNGPIPRSAQSVGSTGVSISAHAGARPAAAAAPRHERIELLSSSTSTSARNSPAVGAGDVIDLTLDSDDESEPSVPTRPAQSNGAPAHAPRGGNHHLHANAGAASTSSRPGGFTSYASPSTATPSRTGPFAAAIARVDATPEDEQIRRPGKRPRTEAIPTPSDPRLVNGQRPGHSAASAERRTSLPASYLDTGANGSRRNGNEDGSAGQGSTRGAYRDHGRGPNGEDESGDDSWMDRANNTDQDQYMNEDEWWP